MQQQPASSLNDRAYLTEIYQQYAPGIFAYLYRHLGTIEDTEDLLLEVFLAALERPDFDQLEEKAQKAWLWCVARNKMTDLYRKRRRTRNVSLDLLPENIYEQDLETPEALFLRQEDISRLQRSLRYLSAPQQEVVRLRFALGLRSVEIAEVLQKSDGAVRIMLSRALKLLRKLYEHEQEGQ